jgi:hypothetical protein
MTGRRGRARRAGKPVAARLVAAGHQVTVWNRPAGNAEPLAAWRDRPDGCPAARCRLSLCPSGTPAASAFTVAAISASVDDKAPMRVTCSWPLLWWE